MLNWLFKMNIKGVIKPDLAYPAKTGKTWDEWHRIFGHMHMGAVKMMKDKEMVLGMEVELAAQCTACITAKQHIKPYPKESHMEIKRIGDLTVSDTWGPACMQAPGGDQYFVMFTDGKSQWMMIYFLKQPSKSSSFTEALLKLRLEINSRSFMLMVEENISARNSEPTY